MCLTEEEKLAVIERLARRLLEGAWDDARFAADDRNDFIRDALEGVCEILYRPIAYGIGAVEAGEKLLETKSYVGPGVTFDSAFAHLWARTDLDSAIKRLRDCLEVKD